MQINEKYFAELEFSYDYMGRRVERKLFSWSGTDWTLEEHEKYVWYNWNIIEILDEQNSDSIKRSLVWGLDITGDLTAAGGVGALLSIYDETGAYYALYDANGNIGQYINSTGAIVAKYEYSPEPGFSLKEGTLADELASVASFSTKPYDKDLDAFRYQLRILKNSRWMSRDPIGERVGINLYVFLRNDLINTWDILGLIDEFTRLLFLLQGIDPDIQHDNNNQPGDELDKMLKCQRACAYVITDDKFREEAIEGLYQMLNIPRQIIGGDDPKELLKNILTDEIIKIISEKTGIEESKLKGLKEQSLTEEYLKRINMELKERLKGKQISDAIEDKSIDTSKRQPLKQEPPKQPKNIIGGKPAEEAIREANENAEIMKMIRDNPLF